MAFCVSLVYGKTANFNVLGGVVREVEMAHIIGLVASLSFFFQTSERCLQK